jgi:hypothetical protein
MRMTLVVGLVVGAGVVAGCGDSGGAPLDCDWLASDNCWKTTARPAASCLPPETEQGVLSADGRRCEYANGVSVVFKTPLQLPVPDDPVWNFTVTGADGQACLHYEQASSGSITLVVGGDTFNESVSPAGLRATCPDGSSYVLPLDKLDEILQCPGGLFGLPGHSWSSSSTSASFSLIGTSSTSSEALPVFSCSRAPN